MTRSPLRRRTQMAVAAAAALALTAMAACSSDSGSGDDTDSDSGESSSEGGDASGETIQFFLSGMETRAAVSSTWRKSTSRKRG